MIVRVSSWSFNESLYTFVSGNDDVNGVRVDRNKSNRGKFSVPARFDEGFGCNGRDDEGAMTGLFDDAGGSVNLNLERIIDTEQETRAEPLLSSLTCEFRITRDETKMKDNDIASQELLKTELPFIALRIFTNVCQFLSTAV